MNRKIIFRSLTAVNIILGIWLIISVIGAVNELNLQYVEADSHTPRSLVMYLEREEYGVAAGLARPVRGGELITGENEDYYRIGEYAELSFLKEIYVKKGATETVAIYENRLASLRDRLPEYASIFDKIDTSVINSIKE